jgi:hypothetical protein
MSEKTDVWQGALALMALKTSEALWPSSIRLQRRDLRVAPGEEILTVIWKRSVEWRRQSATSPLNTELSHGK